MKCVCFCVSKYLDATNDRLLRALHKRKSCENRRTWIRERKAEFTSSSRPSTCTYLSVPAVNSTRKLRRPTSTGTINSSPQILQSPSSKQRTDLTLNFQHSLEIKHSNTQIYKPISTPKTARKAITRETKINFPLLPTS